MLSASYVEMPTPPSGAPSPVQQCATPSWSFSGTQNRTSGNLTLACATSGATIQYKKNGGTTTNYSTPLALICTQTADEVEFWAIKSGLSTSTHRNFDNTHTPLQEGGGGFPPGGHGGFQ
jgi:hypothetical protein